MNQSHDHPLSPVIFIPHGGGPLPLIGDPEHLEMVDFLKQITPDLGTPSAIVIISAHWEEEVVTITSGKTPALIYDYFNFPEETYNIDYPLVGDPELAENIHHLLTDHAIPAKLDDQRGFDHGVFVPLKIMYPKADIPCVQISLLKNMDAAAHVRVGQALAELRNQNVLVIGSGFTFHNMNAFSPEQGKADEKNKAFESWLIDVCTNEKLSPAEREQQLSKWADAPFARYCHPREEHLLPLHVCYGFCNSPAKLVFDGQVISKKVSSFLW